jgi:hypothetical protein
MVVLGLQSLCLWLSYGNSAVIASNNPGPQFPNLGIESVLPQVRSLVTKSTPGNFEIAYHKIVSLYYKYAY